MTWTEDNPWTMFLIACVILTLGTWLHFVVHEIKDFNLYLIAVLLGCFGVFVLVLSSVITEKYKTKRSLRDE